ncbi:MAG: signal peptidase I [Tractidigestivibacter sp.]|jgi:signal peptidase I|uniref:signal peptidase I n=1 Tax=Tractidigestivibacter sp. TaxID=2847320 RepID=UPI003D8D5259
MSEAKARPDKVPDSNGPAVIDSEKIERERERVGRAMSRRHTAMVVAGTIVVVAAIAIVMSNTLFSVLQVRGTSMEPTITEGDIIVTNRSQDFGQGDIIAFYYNNKILLKRVIAFPGDWVDIDSEGNVFVNGEHLEEAYVSDLALGNTDITFPYQVPDSSYFVLGDHRSVSVDSRSSVVGTVTKEQVIGKVLFCVFPFEHFGAVT